MKKFMPLVLLGLFVLTNCTKDFEKNANLANEVVNSHEFVGFLNSFISYVDLTSEAFGKMTEDELQNFFQEFDKLKKNYTSEKYNDMLHYTNSFSKADFKECESELKHRFHDVVKKFPYLKIYEKQDFSELVELVDHNNLHLNIIYSHVIKGMQIDPEKDCEDKCYADFEKRKWATIVGAVAEAAVAAAADGPLPVGDALGMAGAIWALYKGAKLNKQLLEICLANCKN